jgi:RNA polymerase sigma-70 factor (ECF subfamily)
MSSTLSAYERQESTEGAEAPPRHSLIVDARSRSEAAREFDALMRENAQSVHRYLALRGVSTRDVPDVAQNVFLLAHRKWSDFRGEATRRAWLFGIAKNCAADYRKQRDRRQAAYESYGAVVDAAPCAVSGPEDHTQTSAALRMLHAVLNELKEPLRNAFVLYEIEELTMTEIAAIEGIPEQTGYSRLRAARAAVEQRFADLEAGDA